MLAGIKSKYKKQPVNTIDGVKIEFDNEWVHLRKSNTEPIIRIYSESQSQTTAKNLAEKIISDIKDLIAETVPLPVVVFHDGSASQYFPLPT